jgi:hypothetical protein
LESFPARPVKDLMSLAPEKSKHIAERENTRIVRSTGNGTAMYGYQCSPSGELMERRHEMGLKGLAEGIIIQSMEDLWNENHKEDCVVFFRGEDFRLCAELAGMSLAEQVKLLDMVKSVVDYHNRAKQTEEIKSAFKGMQQTRRGGELKSLSLAGDGRSHSV